MKLRKNIESTNAIFAFPFRLDIVQHGLAIFEIVFPNSGTGEINYRIAKAHTKKNKVLFKINSKNLSQNKSTRSLVNGVLLQRGSNLR